MAQNHMITSFFSFLFFMILLHSAICNKSSSFHQSSGPSVSLPSLHSHSSLVKAIRNFTQTVKIIKPNANRYGSDLATNRFYFTTIGVGQPVRDFNFVIDTTSDLTWLQCQCTSCFDEYGYHVFYPDKSTSYRQLPCTSPKCMAYSGNDDCGSNDPCEYQVDSPGGSSTSGNLATEIFTLDGGPSFKNVVIGCGQDYGGSLGGAVGVLGFSKGALSFPSQIKLSSFSYCAISRDSHSMSALYFNFVPVKDSFIVPMLPNPNPRFKTLYYVEVAGISVAGTRLDIPKSVFQIRKNGFGGVIIDSGTDVTLLPRQAYRKLRQAFVDKTQDLEPLPRGSRLLDTCFQLPYSSLPQPPLLGDSSNEAAIPEGIFPAVDFHFAGGKTLSLGASNCLVSAIPNVVCLSFAAADGRVSVIGNRMQQGTRITFDLANEKIGFTPNQC